MYGISFIRRMEYEIIIDNIMLLWYNSVALHMEQIIQNPFKLTDGKGVHI